MFKKVRLITVGIPIVLMGAVLILGATDPNFTDTMTAFSWSSCTAVAGWWLLVSCYF